jgi:F0F1-type ATP synthase membrane subunit c/vacuolar-type H+-ATPase subunit K
VSARARTCVIWAVLALGLGLFAVALAEGLAASAITSALAVLGAATYLTTRRARIRAARRRL